MARFVHTLQSLNAEFANTGKNLTMVAAVPANDEEVPMGQRTLILAHNTHATLAKTVTITSTPLNGRTGDITAHSIPVDGIAIFGPFKPAGWAQASGSLYFEADDAAIVFACINVR